MRNILFVLFIFLSFIANGQITFNKTYDSGIDNTFNTLEVTDGFITATTAGQPINPRFIFLIKTDFNGDTLWEKKYGDSTFYTAIYSLIKLSESRIITGCYAYDFIQNISFIYLLKLKYDGDTIWTKKIFAPAGFDFYGQYITLTSDKELLISGELADSLLNDGNAFILKADTNGNYLWHQTFGGALFDAFYSSIETSDKGFLSLGWTRSFGFGNLNNRDVYLVKTDSQGNFEWQKTYGDANFESAFGITALMDNNYLLAADKIINNIEYAWIIKIDSSGSVIWENSYNFGLLSEIWWSRELVNKDIISIGACRNSTNQKDEGLIFCTNEHGYLKWHRTFPMFNNHAYFRDVQPTSDGGFICAGFCFTGASGNQDAWLVKLDSLGCDSADCPVYYTAVEEPGNPMHNHTMQLLVYPNPAVNMAIVQTEGFEIKSPNMIQIYGLMGNSVPVEIAYVNRNSVSFNTKNLANGIYFVKYAETATGISATTKFLVVH